jgi:hypothetical protein
MLPAAVLTTVVFLLALGFWLADVARPLIPYKALLWAHYGPALTVYVAVLALNTFAASYTLVRALGLKRAGRKLAHLDYELRSDSAIGAELARLENPSQHDS